MWAAAGRRLLAALPTLLGVTLVTFLVMEAAPGDPAALAARGTAPGVDRAEVESRLRAFMELDRPAAERYLVWLGRAATFDFGRSLVNGEPVSARLARALPPTLILGAAALLLGLLVSVPLGVWCAGRAGSRTDRAVSGVLLALYSIPPWVAGLFLILLFSVWLDWLPLGGWRSGDWAELSLAGKAVDIAAHAALILVATLLPCLAHDARFVRQAVLEELEKDHITAARARGLPEGRVLWVHALRGALVPIVTLAGLSLPLLISGSVIMEQIFRWPGMGRLFFTALQARDYPVIMAVTTLGAVLVVAGNLFADLAAILADPRLRRG